MKPKTIITIISVVALIILFQNTQVMTMQVFFWKISMSRIIWALLIFILGACAGFLMSKKSWWY